MSLRKLRNLDANDILNRMSIDEVDEGHREEVWIEELSNGEVIDNWFIGADGAISYSGSELTSEEWNERCGNIQDGGR